MKINTRSWSGVLPISIALDGRFFSCEYDCSFCPNECREQGADQTISRSYLSSEGTFKRGRVSEFDPARQVIRRLFELQEMGHVPDKLEIIVLGGTWDCHPRDYREAFIHGIYYGCNLFADLDATAWLEKKPFQHHLPLDDEMMALCRPRESLEDEKTRNETRPLARIVGLVLETRPDRISLASMTELRRFGCTRVQLGLQHTDDDILQRNRRGHCVLAGVLAIERLKNNGFKVDGHLMPDLPYASPEADARMFEIVFESEDYQLDYVKIYPCLSLPFTMARRWKEEGVWTPYAESDYPLFVRTLAEGIARVKPWTRINRIHRDFPEASEKNMRLGYESETIRTNLNQYVQEYMVRHHLPMRDIRSREIKNNQTITLEGSDLWIRSYRANGATEYFLSVEKEGVLFGFVRLRLPPAQKKCTSLFTFLRKDGIARIRELHVYGFIAGTTGKQSIQHKGVGKFLMWCAENVAVYHGCHTTAVISGVGVRDYYRRLGYSLEKDCNEFMLKTVRPAFSVFTSPFFVLSSIRLRYGLYRKYTRLRAITWFDVMLSKIISWITP